MTDPLAGSDGPVAVGDRAPDFTLPDANNVPVTLSELLVSKAVLLVFYPFAFSRICSGELSAVRDDLASFQNHHVQVLGISTDPPPTLQAWSRAEGYSFPLLSDFWPHGETARAYGCFLAKAGMAVRGTFLVEPSGTVVFAEVKGPGEVRDQAGWRRAVAALSGRGSETDLATAPAVGG
ncbi:peroxiredoxin [Nakamurella flavida]|uniref:Alkyl hydroperoxide reductase E n=1 Tax=Nakamurella flavida TaxID=363630 RepID=A0A938YHL4_9ACTN|nr:peroxiredoxin [Nakamurella flavida]MBM9474903.1 peroxiredoxin [Nakamurella flavida]MDP9776472.1 peroxiredoxin (alkyl hydroperoxide reductase subunit C) [Nakamurella flavida]